MSDDFSIFFNRIIETEGEDKARMMISNIMLDFFEHNKINIELIDATPHYKKFEIGDPNGQKLMTLNIEVRWMGEDTGKRVLYWADQAMKNALNSYLGKISID